MSADLALISPPQESYDVFLHCCGYNRLATTIEPSSRCHSGCYIAIGDIDKAQDLLDHLPNVADKKKVGGKELPTEVVIRKKGGS